MHRVIAYCLLGCVTMAMLPGVVAQENETLSGQDIMVALVDSHLSEKTVYEEFSVILTDDMGNRNTRQLRKFFKLDDNNHYRFLMVFDTPDEYEGVAIMVDKPVGAWPDITIYLPAYGDTIKQPALWKHNEPLFGTDFTLRELMGVLANDYRFERAEDRRIDNIDYYIVDVYDAADGSGSSSLLMQHYIRQNSLSLVRTDYFDKYGRLVKKLTMHDMDYSDDGPWDAAMVLMEDRLRNHSTLIKIDRRIVSDTYVPDNVFSLNWLYENRPPLEIEPGEQEELESELIDADDQARNPVLIITGGLR